MIRYQKDTDNIVTLTLDRAGEKYNVLNHEISEQFLEVVRHLQREKQRKALRGVIITSAKKNWLTGGELDYLYQTTDPQQVYELAEKLKFLFRQIERPGVPVVAAINGTAIAAGFEFALACHHRIVLDQPGIRVGLSEVNYGQMPGNGGTVRLMWLLGIERAYPILSEGRALAPRAACRAGIVDELAENEEELLRQARTWILNQEEGRRPWDQPEGRIPGGTADDPHTARRIAALAAGTVKRTRDLYPAPLAILNTMAEGSLLGFDAALEIESRYYAELVCGQVAKNMTKAFWFDTNAIKRGDQRPKGYGKFRPKKVGIIGAGLMGSGIAFSALSHGMEVVLKDVSRMVAKRGLDNVTTQFQRQVEAGSLNDAECRTLLDRIQTTETSDDFEDCDLVIEAVFENENVKKKVTREATEHLDEYALFASNTISIPITKLSEAALRPENYVGLHFFYPVEEVPLVEIVRGKNTSEETVARAFDFVRAIKKIPIVVTDDWGFYVARVRNTYVLEGVTMLQEGYPPALIENLGRQSGMPVGPLELADAMGLELVLRYERQAADHYGKKYIQHPAVDVLDRMVELERTGKRKHAGFYQYGGERDRIWTELTEHFPTTQDGYDRQRLTERFLFAQVLEAIWCLTENVITTVPEANLGSIHGWGFPAARGGVVQYIADFGKEAFQQRAAELEAAHGQRFRVPKMVEELS